MERYARFAARGLAKSHGFALWLGGDADEATARALSGPALLVAPPGWYAASGVFGTYATEVEAGPHADPLAGVRRYLDWFRFNQELYLWHGKLAYGFWQTRLGEIHRHDRWDLDYGRWGWSLGDGAGRIGHLLMLEYLRTLERRYLVAGEAYDRAVHDTSLVHTLTHLENATATWWRVQGTNHRHGVQPFGGPFVGMRGSYPYGQRILWLLAGDGTVKDGLDLVAQAALDFATARPGAFGASGGPDGQGSGAIALLAAYESSGDRRHLEACRTILDRSGLIPGEPDRPLSYAADFGLFLAAEEYLDLTGDADFRRRLLALADRAVSAEDRRPFLTVLARAARETGEAQYRTAIEEALGALDFSGSLAELPVSRWPGHGGPRLPPSRANVGRDLPYALAAFHPPRAPGDWPEPASDPLRLPADVPQDWFRPGGQPGPADRPPDAASLLRTRPRPREDVVPFVALAGRDRGGHPVLASGDAPHRLRVLERTLDGRPSLRVEMAVSVPPGRELAAFGVRVPLRLSDDPARIHVHAAGAFRVERWRADLNDERIPEWLNSDSRTRWPLWHGGGILLGPGGSYRIYRLSRRDTSPVFVDSGRGSPGWLDVTDRGGEEPWGVTARLLRDPADDAVGSVAFDLDSREIVISFRSEAGMPLSGVTPRSGAADLLFHDGWRPPLSPPDLTREQYRRFLDDLDRGPNIGLFALRYLLAEDHRVPPGPWKERLADLGVEPREILAGMEWRGALEEHCRRIGVRHDAERVDATIRDVIGRYRR